MSHLASSKFAEPVFVASAPAPIRFQSLAVAPVFTPRAPSKPSMSMSMVMKMKLKAKAKLALKNSETSSRIV